MGFAECQQKIGFFSHEDARATAKKKRQIVKAEKKLAELHAPLSPDQLGEDLRQTRAQTKVSSLVEAKVVSPVFANRVPASSFRDHNSPAAEAAQDALIYEMSAAKQKRKPKAAPKTFAVAKDPDARFRQALEIQERQRAGDPVGEREASWLEGYQNHPEFEARIELHKSFGGNDAG